MSRIALATSLFAFFAALALTAPAVANEGHIHADEAVEAHNNENMHDHEHDHGEDHPHEDEATHVFEAESVKVIHPWMNSTSSSEVLIFLELENSGAESVMLRGANVPFAKEALLVGFTLEGGRGAYQTLPFVPVKPGHRLDFAPEGLAIRATGLTADFSEGDTATITLLTSAGNIDVIVVVEAEDARQHSHAGHIH